jgi:MinD-like ATPase involved in chromosome partitioning or flagellar assembly
LNGPHWPRDLEPGGSVGEEDPESRAPSPMARLPARVPTRNGASPSSEREPPWRSSSRPLRRDEVYSRPVVDGRELPDTVLTRLRHRVRVLSRSRGEQRELQLERRLREVPGVSRPNTVAVISPKGGVGKTTATFLLGDLLSSHLRLKTIAVDANPDFGTLARLAPERTRADATLAELVGHMERVGSASELRAFVSRVPSGLHLLGAPIHPEVMAEMGPDTYERVAAFLAQFYDVVLLDCGTGITDPLARFAVDRSDQIVVVATPEWMTSDTVLGALRHLPLDRATLVLNRSGVGPGDRRAIESSFARQRLSNRTVVPYDEQLGTMLDSGTYALERLRRRVRLPIKQLGLAVGEQLV